MKQRSRGSIPRRCILSDANASRRRSQRTVRTGYGEGELAWHAASWTSQPGHVAGDLQQAVDWILRQTK
jgi:hypothetical protein